jgi:hypothetical protein
MEVSVIRGDCRLRAMKFENFSISKLFCRNCKFQLGDDELSGGGRKTMHEALPLNHSSFEPSPVSCYVIRESLNLRAVHKTKPKQ